MQPTPRQRFASLSLLALLLCGALTLVAAHAAPPPLRTTKALKKDLRLKKPPKRLAKKAPKAKKAKALKKFKKGIEGVKKKLKLKKKLKEQTKQLQGLQVQKKAKKLSALKPKKRAKASTKPAKKPKSAKKAKKAKPRGTARKQRVRQWLALGPARLPMPAFHREKRGKYTHNNMLTQQHAPHATWQPKAGQRFDWLLGRVLKWRNSSGRLRRRGAGPQVAYLATYLDTDRYVKLKLKVRSHQRLRVFLDGKLVATKAGCTSRHKRRAKRKPAKRRAAPRKRPVGPLQVTPLQGGQGGAIAPTARQAAPPVRKAAPADPKAIRQMMQLLSQQAKIIETQAKTIASQGKQMRKAKRSPKRRKRTRRRKPGMARGKLTLTPGIHLLVIKSLYTPGCIKRWGVRASIHKTKKSSIPKTFEITRTPYRRHSLSFYFHRTHLGGLSLSPDGKQVLVRKYKWTRQQRWAYWLERRSTRDGKLLFSGRPYNRLLGIQWSPDGKHYSFVSTHGRKRKKTLWVVNRATGKVRALLQDVAKMGGHRWAPNGRFLLYSVSSKEKLTKQEKVGAKRLRGMDDRNPKYRHRSHLYAVTVKSGLSIRLTAGKLSTSGTSISADSKRILFTRSKADYSKRPFHSTNIFELTLATLKVRKVLANLRWVNGVSYGPAGQRLLLLGGPSMLGNLGRSNALKPKTLANDYEGEAYIYHLKKRQFRVISRNFAPHIAGAHWHNLDGKIYFTALDKTRYKLFQFDPKTGAFAQIPTDVDLTTQVKFARNSSQIVYLGQGIQHPNRLYTLDLFAPQPKLLLAPNRKWLSRLTLAKVKNFVTTSRRGHRIEGRVYYPPNFDPRKKYPAIVYYYGGTFPTPRYFDGAYSGQVWGAHGYVTYILNPSGAIGYGQRFAARHVNEWGTIVPEEIIDATKDFLKAHKFVDPKRVGCTGASYGGFTTMSIVTKSSLFAAAISHAGISNITSYWGDGFWGYWYSAIAAATRFPWSHPHYFVKQSPLFFAHKVTTPLLLLHGDSDKNVPPAESYQMYTALRLLKKKVELVLFKREGHGVRNYKKRQIWVKTILAWFDNHLKKQPLWWHQMYGKRQH